MADDRRSPLLWPTKTNKMCSAMSSARGGNTASTEEGLACGKKMVFPMKPFCRSAWGSTTGCRTVTCMHTRTRGKSRFVPAERERSSGKALPSHRSFARAWRQGQNLGCQAGAAVPANRGRLSCVFRHAPPVQEHIFTWEERMFNGRLLQLTRPIALSPAFRALDTHDLRRGLRARQTNRTLACISRTRHARSPQRVARAAGKSHSRVHFAHSTRTISAEGCARSRQIALSPAFRALDTHDLRRGLRAHPADRTLACISRIRHARSPQRVARTPGQSHSRLHFAHSTRTISAEGCARTGQIALSPAFRALDTHDLRRGLRAHPADRTLACISRTRHARSPQRVALSVDAVRPALRL